MLFKYFLSGAAAKTLASFDDAVTRIPVIAQVTRTRTGKIAFGLGNLLAVTAAIGLAYGLARVLGEFPHTRKITAVLILVLAAAVYFDVFGKKERQKVAEQKRKVKYRISRNKFFYLIGVGFVVSLVTLLDDFVVLTPLFLGDYAERAAAISGIYTSTIVQIIAVIYLSEWIARLRYVKETAVFGLAALAVLVYFNIV